MSKSASPSPGKRPNKTPKAPRIVAAEFVAGATEGEQLPPPVGLEIAFAGRSNVGKSTLLNGLMGRKNLARTSRTPGCTRKLVLFEVRGDDGSKLTLVDLPGYGYAQRSKAERHAWGQLIESYLMERPTLAAVAILVDSRRGIEEEEAQLIEFLRQPAKVSRRPVEVVLIATKLDKVPVSGRKLVLQSLAKQAGHRVVGFTEREPELADAIWLQLRRAAGLIPLPTPSAEPAPSAEAAPESVSQDGA